MNFGRPTEDHDSMFGEITMEDQYWLQTTCLDCQKQTLHAMADAPGSCQSCGSRRINSVMVSDDVVRRHLMSKKARSG